MAAVVSSAEAVPSPMETETVAEQAGVNGGPSPMETEVDAPPMAAGNTIPPEVPPLKVTFYQLLIRQLQDDGFAGEATSISGQMNIQPDAEVGHNALFEAYGKSLKWAFGEEPREAWVPVLGNPVPPIAADEQVLDFTAAANGVGGIQTAKMPGAQPAAGSEAAKRTPEVKLLYTATHKQPCRAVSFSGDGRLCATGCADGSIKILDCARMRACAASIENPLSRMRISDEELQKPVTRTLQDHVLGVTCLAFHPTNPTLFSGSLDKAVKIFDLTRPPGHKKAFSVLQDVHPVRSLCIHPCGDFLFVGTAHQAVRLYDLQTLNCFTTFDQDHHHGGGINDIRCSSDGRIFATASADGALQIWDAVSHGVINRLPRSHSGAGVTSLRWSRNLRYLLSSGLDGRHRIWDVRQGTEVFNIGFGPRTCDYSTAVFAANERYVVAVNSNWRLSDASLFDAQTGSPVFMKMGLHMNAVRALDASPADHTVFTGCDDEKGRFLSIGDQRS